MLTLGECIEKQKAKPVMAQQDDLMITYRCPRCRTGLAARVGSVCIGHQNKYCSNCGQKLDWSVI